LLDLTIDIVDWQDGWLDWSRCVRLEKDWQLIDFDIVEYSDAGIVYLT